MKSGHLTLSQKIEHIQRHGDGNVYHVLGNNTWFHVIGPLSAQIVMVKSQLVKVGRDWIKISLQSFSGNGKPLKRGGSMIRFIYMQIR